MARPPKKGLDYFPHDTDAADDSALAFIEAKHSLTGYAVYFKLLERIYGEDGYFMPWDAREKTIMARRLGIKPADIDAIVADCIAEGLFDGDIHEEHGILTSKGIQSRYLRATERRTRTHVEYAFLLTET